jgi:hypothetical protein
VSFIFYLSRPSTSLLARDVLLVCVSVHPHNIETSCTDVARSWTCKTKCFRTWGMRGPCSIMPTDGRYIGQRCPVTMLAVQWLRREHCLVILVRRFKYSAR